jgi:hypothetical protein
LLLEEGVHSAIGSPRAENFEWEEDRERQEEPGKQAELQKTSAQAEVIHVGRFQRGIIVPVDARQAKSIRIRTMVAYREPDGLNAAVGERDPEEPLALTVGKDGGAHLEIVIALDFDPIQERLFLGMRGKVNAQPAGIQDICKSNRSLPIWKVRPQLLTRIRGTDPE